MQDLELDLKDWRNHPSPETMRSKSLQHERTFPLRSAIGVSVAATIVLVAFLLTRSNPAQAALARMNASLKNVESVWMDTNTMSVGNRVGGKGITIIAHGSLRRDGLRGLRAYRGKEGSWYFDPALDAVIRENKEPPSRYYSPRNYVIENLLIELDPEGVIDHGLVDADGTQSHFIEFNHGSRGITEFWIDPQSGLPTLIVERRGEGNHVDGTCRFRYDVRIDPSVMTPEALAKPLTDLIRPFPPESPNTR